MIIQSLMLAAMLAGVSVLSGAAADSGTSAAESIAAEAEAAESDDSAFDIDAYVEEDDELLPPSPETIAKYEGDWVGALTVESTSIPFLDFVGKTWDVVARFAFDEDGTLNLFLRTPFPDWEFDFRDVHARLDPWLEDVFLEAKFVGFPMKQPTILSFTYTFDGSLTVKTILEADEAGSAEFAMTLRRIGDDWTGEEVPGFDPEEAASFKGKTLGEVMDCLKMSARDMPEETHVGDAETSADYAYDEDDPYLPES